MECKCYIKEEDGVEPQIIKCPLCKSAPDLYEVLTELMEACSRHDQTGINISYNTGKVALAKACRGINGEKEAQKDNK